MRYLALLILLTSSFVHAGIHPLLNDREGSSYILGSRTVKKIERIGSTRESLEQVYKDIISTQKGEACAFNIVSAVNEKINQFPEYQGDKELFLNAIRHQGIIDDVMLNLYLRALWVMKDVDLNTNDELNLPSTEVSADMKAIKEFSLKRSRGKCLHENFKELLSSYRRDDKNFTTKTLRRKIDQGLKENLITERAASELWEAMDDDISSWEISLAEYVSKRNFLRSQFPIPLPDERSDFVASKAGKLKMSHRQKLYFYYSPVQITLMGNVIKKLKDRLESPRIEILVYDDENQVQETLTLDPMERFRFAIRVLRKEMKLLSTNNYFLGRQPSYTDLMAAAYEAGIVTAVELDQVAKLEEIWNPKKSFWDKAAVWVRMFGGVLSVVVPPPYGFLPALAITAIEALTRDAAPDDQDSLF
ncbi:MAG: hypothetical protein K2P81_02850 [Bacteriovoracaceae bacterium]|nr:hypothetical protein [Bacteriovoracaceae bacterium]